MPEVIDISPGNLEKWIWRNKSTSSTTTMSPMKTNQILWDFFFLTSVLVVAPRCLSGEESSFRPGDTGLIPELGRSPGVGNGNPFQYSCLESSMDRGSWWAAVHGSQGISHDWACMNTHILSWPNWPRSDTWFEHNNYSLLNILQRKSVWFIVSRPKFWSIFSHQPCGCVLILPLLTHSYKGGAIHIHSFIMK